MIEGGYFKVTEADVHAAPCLSFFISSLFQTGSFPPHLSLSLCSAEKPVNPLSLSSLETGVIIFPRSMLLSHHPKSVF